VQDQFTRDLGRLPGPGARQGLVVEIDQVDLAKVRRQCLEIVIVSIAGTQNGDAARAARRRPRDGQRRHPRAVIAEVIPKRRRLAVVLAVQVEKIW
jgi:hypothetical protein